MTKRNLPAKAIMLGLAVVAVLLVGTHYVTGERDTAMDLVAMSELALETCGEGNIHRVTIAEPNPGFECKAPRPATTGS